MQCQPVVVRVPVSLPIAVSVAPLAARTLLRWRPQTSRAQLRSVLTRSCNPAAAGAARLRDMAAAPASGAYHASIPLPRRRRPGRPRGPDGTVTVIVSVTVTVTAVVMTVSATVLSP